MNHMAPAELTQALLYMDGVCVSFDGFRALNTLSLVIGPGEMRAIIGPNGAGKTTMMDVMTGKTRPDTGVVLYEGKVDLTTLDEASIAELGIGRKFQTPRVYLNLTARENLSLTFNPHKGVISTLLERSARAEKNTIAGLLETIDLIDKADIIANKLSHGEKQRLEIGMLVAQSPDLLLVDEPVAGLTDEETQKVGDLLVNLAESHSIIVIEHDMEFVRQIARKVTVLHQGSVLCEGSIQQVKNDPRVIEVYLGQEMSDVYA